jgi:flagellar protein FlaG
MAINTISDLAGNIQKPLLTLTALSNAHAINNQTAATESANLVQAGPNEETDAHVEHAVEKIQEAVNSLAQNLKFSIDEETGKTVVKVMDVQTEEVIRQIPSQEAITIARTLDKIQGLLLNDKA